MSSPITLTRLPDRPGARVGAVAARLAGVALLGLIGFIHLVELPGHAEAASYLGMLFGLAVAGAWVAALGVAAGVRAAWLLGALVAVGAMAGLLVAVAVGLPGFRESFAETLAVPSLVVEGLYLALGAGVAIHRAQRPPA